VITGENAILWYLAVSVVAGFGLVYDIVMLERRCSRQSRRSGPNKEQTAYERIVKTEAAPIYVGCGFDNPEQSWENCLIRMEVLQKEIAGVEAIRSRFERRQLKVYSKVTQITGTTKVEFSRNAQSLLNLVGGHKGWRGELVRWYRFWIVAAWRKRHRPGGTCFRAKQPERKLAHPSLSVVGNRKEETK
jgi:hypothetical protein